MTAHDDWVDRARASSLADAAQLLGLKVPRRGEFQGPCPACGGTDRFSVNIAKGAWNCRGAHGGHDAIGLVMHARGVDFLAAVEMLTGEAPPRGETHIRERDPSVEKERQEERKDAAIVESRKQAADLSLAIERATALFERGIMGNREFLVRPIEDTLAEDYLDARGIPLYAISTHDLRFVKELTYRGHEHARGALGEDGNPLPDDEIELGSYHCMIAAVRDAQGRIIGVHRTYLDVVKSSGGMKTAPQAIKLIPPGDKWRNKAKKGTFRMGGGMIMLSEMSDTLAVAEGIETACSWRVLARDGAFGDELAGAAVAAAYSIGNMCGKSTGTIQHPNPPNGAIDATLPNGEPDMNSTAIWIPPGVKRIVLIGDADADAASVLAKLKTGVERFRRLGLEVIISMPKFTKAWGDGAKLDWNDVLLDVMKRERRAAA